ncbi:MAG: hypothetical protein EA424_26655 [Planctomycetaceae bacterium]|nr:MAG: hypothetical protein EA424_26655 [Planctomycetaceae bacterium]
MPSSTEPATIPSRRHFLRLPVGKLFPPPRGAGSEVRTLRAAILIRSELKSDCDNLRRHFFEPPGCQPDGIN